ncbi:MAG TPA: prephenate dehydrogenase/arogenate dehydrogenase family protein [Dehalococcoidia bacterium]|nr:prephenate dehydrogenase/arogenate dehydrogenase family protein [Dehalococcoidia bacterium]
MGKVGIIGLGLIGGSIGLALRNAGLRDTTVLGFDRDREVEGRALKYGAVDALARSLEQLAAESAIIVIATPIIAVEKVMREIAPHLQKGAVVTDTASTKGAVMRWAREILPPGVHFVGGHPMAGKEQSGPQAAEPGLFRDRPYVIVPAVDAGPGAVNAVIGLAETLGARPMFLDADEHDAYAAAISHVPLVASVALFGLARGSTAWPELAGMAGPAFKDLTRLASGEPEMAHDICLTNKQNISHWIDRYIDELLRLKDLIAGEDDEALFRALAEAQLERENFLVSPPERERPGLPDDLPSPSQSFMNLLAGSMWAERARELTKSLETRERERERAERLRRRRE